MGVEHVLVDYVLPAVFAGTVAILVTVAIERWGGVVGGLLGTMPTTIVPASIGIARAAATWHDFKVAMYAVPAGMLLDVFFLWLWRVIPSALPPWSLASRLAVTVATTLLVWGVLVVGLVLALDALPPKHLVWVAWGVTAGIFAAGVAATYRPRPAPKGGRPVTLFQLVTRGVVAGGAIAVAVLVSEHNSLAGGIASVFPAIFLTTMVSLWVSQGESVPGGAVGPMMVGATSVPAFACFTAIAFPQWGMVIGVPACYTASVLVATLPGYTWVRWRQSKAPPPADPLPDPPEELEEVEAPMMAE
eukprot:Sspe_Gene.112157::Locus_94889_Transcript_3_3_Confidence_0.700_Length_1320::g.112157::m.112157